jgi:biopolymer transport protein ExbD
MFTGIQSAFMLAQGVKQSQGGEKEKKLKLNVDRDGPYLIMCAPLMGQQLRKRLKRQRRDARNKRVQARLRAGMKK